MKAFNLLLFSITLLLFTCKKDDDNSYDSPEEFTVPLTVDFDALINLPPGSEASAAVSVGESTGTPNAEFTTTAKLNDNINWEIQSNSSSTDVILFDAISIVGGDVWIADSNYFELVVPPNPDNFPYPEYKIKIDKARADQDLEVKYNINFYMERDGVRSGPYYIDPKIQIRRTN